LDTAIDVWQGFEEISFVFVTQLRPFFSLPTSMAVFENFVFSWKVFNNIILGSQDAIVAGYPRVLNTDRNQYLRYELDYVM
jgi:hypothetical protein